MRHASLPGRLALSFFLSLSLSTRGNAQDLPAAGFQVSPLFNPGGGTCTLSNGDVVSFDGQSIDRWAADGTFLANLGTLPAPVFGGCMAVDATDTFAVVGETSNGDLFKVDLSGGGMSLLANLNFNYDALFDPAGRLVVSAAICGFGCGNDLVRVDATSGATTTLAHVSGPSGPIAMDPAGDLFYATQSALFPPPLGSTDVVALTAAQLEGGVVLGDSDLLSISTGFDGGSSLAFDPVRQRLLLAENNFGTGTNRVFEVGPSQAASEVLVEGPIFGWIAGLEFVASAGAALYEPFQPAEGGRLIYGSTDFFSYDLRNALEPARPEMAFSGPGTSGPGALTLAVEGGAPNGLVMVFIGPSSLYSASETPYYFFGTLPLFTGLDLGTAHALPQLIVLDGQGAGAIQGSNPGGLVGNVAAQGLLIDAGLEVVGTTGAALL